MQTAQDITLAELATTLPAASRVFHRHRLDFCCNGGRRLADACAARGLDPAAILAEVEDGTRDASGAVRWDEQPIADLIAHIVSRYHESLRVELPRLFAMARKVERVHGDKRACPRGLEALLAGMSCELIEHLTKEEHVLFPMILGGAGALASAPIRVMLREHEEAGECLARIRALTRDFTPPDEACATWRALYLGLAELEVELMDHIHLENNVLFPRVLRGA